MTTLWYVLLIVALSTLFVLVIRDWQNRAVVDHNWPKGLPRLVKVQIWFLYTVAGLEFHRVMVREFYLHDRVLSFLLSSPVPVDCNDENPVVLVEDQQNITGEVKMLSMRTFDWHYSKYKKFDSMREYRKYMNTTD